MPAGRTASDASSDTGSAAQPTGGCLCGAVRYRARGAPRLVDLCYCRWCARAVGASVTGWARYATGDFAFTAGEPVRYESSPGVARTFCGRCGSSLTYHDPGGELVDVASATLDDPLAFPPTSDGPGRPFWMHAPAGTTRELSIASVLRAAPDALWRHATRPEELNREFWPLLQMRFPSHGRYLAAAFAASGGRIGRCWLLLGGVLPVEYDDVTLVELDPGRRFLERSTLASKRLWEHERTIEPHGAGSLLRDRVRFAPRIAWLAPLYATVFGAVFRLRHRNLRNRFGAAAPRTGAVDGEGR